jgi:energy-converting hydrogenase A subunit M
MTILLPKRGNIVRTKFELDRNCSRRFRTDRRCLYGSYIVRKDSGDLGNVSQMISKNVEHVRDLFEACSDCSSCSKLFGVFVCSSNSI